ncbi:MAG: hypothetical protein IT378_17115 [Sandaracinaceae bacterium]|nr:hypothetical protein [Sandaracinaceae bacterium]
MSDEDRDAIHERKSRLIALALAGLAVSCGGAKPAETTTPHDEPPPSDVQPQVCLSVAVDPESADAGTPPQPVPCLTPMREDMDG